MTKDKNDIENINFIMLEHLKTIRHTQDNHTEYLRVIKRRMTTLEEGQVNVQRQLNHIDGRLVRIEKRLDLVEA